MLRPLCAAALLFVATPQDGPDAPSTKDVFVHLAPAGVLAVAEGGRLDFDLLLRAGDGRDGDLGEPLSLVADAIVTLDLKGGQPEDARLVDARGRPLAGELRVKAGRARVRFSLEALADLDATALEELEVRIRAVAPRSGEGEAPAKIGALDRARVLVRGPAGPVVQFSHSTPETYPYPSVKIVERGVLDYWGMRLTDSGGRSETGTIEGQPLRASEPLEITFDVSGSAELGVDVELFGHQVVDGGSGPRDEPLPVADGRVSIVIPADADGWVLWGRIAQAKKQPLEQLNLRIVRAVGVETGAAYTIGWNDRAEWWLLRAD